jgi:hypothetical protein
VRTDEEISKGAPENSFASGDLKAYLDKNGKGKKKKVAASNK